MSSKATSRTALKQTMKIQIITALCVTVGCSSVMGLVKLRHFHSTHAFRSSLTANDATVHPTTVPFKRDQQACETSGREWQEGGCLDREHSPTF
ncbi:MAG: hypothetical protein AAFZ80_07820 [Cyanobacteria bacterium P01_A01_bin.105]